MLRQAFTIFPVVVWLLLGSLSSGCRTENGKTAQANKINFQLEKKIEISDSSGDFFFKYPDNPYERQIQVTPDGHVFVLDAGRILEFDPTGKFLKDIMETGQGPGEITRIKTFLLAGDRIIIYNAFPAKLIFKRRDGTFLKEFRIETYLHKFFGVHDNHYYFFHFDLPVVKGNEAQIIDIDHYLTIVSTEGTIEKQPGCGFPIQTFIASNGGYGTIDLVDLLWVHDQDQYYYISHTGEYGIKQLDIANQKITRVLKRKYQRQKPPQEVARKLGMQAFQLNGKIYRRPAQEFLSDIQQLLVYKDMLWVVTSTVDKEKGVLIDTYNREGKFNGSFYLKLSSRLGYLDYFSFNAVIHGDFLYMIEKDANDSYLLVKYRITRLN